MGKVAIIFLITFSFLQASGQILTINSGYSFPETNLLESIIKEGFKRANIALKYQPLPNQRSLINANNGVDDGEAARIWEINEHYPNLIRIPVAIHSIDLVVLSRENLHIKESSDLTFYNVGVIRGMKIAEQITENAKPLSITKTTNHITLIKMLSSHRLDVIVTSKISLLSGLNETKEKNLFMLSKPLVSRPLYMHLHKKHKKLIPQLEEAFNSMIEDGTLKQIRDTFLKDLESHIANTVRIIKDD
ncbi:transporter substrate-binding domain-containing protein [Candidatus Sulfurimonas marisnigri]|uniref:Transporter substrate-binding domain-containing protein n=1 Tax=Candidatus Sulfurimonas marisnigri TaxID=2740405 RepID=A0A7S7LYN0_9BACT|nr:transporter substrate-binding domain-containing protein [Candidatus Sulfurimonas marisnigri]QOY53852.1 transporter substrate-binding domain-containing protein [Candidatus Sulfurimonas marisnigri]